MEATGYTCVDKGIIEGKLGTKPEAFFYIRLRLKDVWPIAKYIQTYGEVKLFSMIEILYDYVSAPINPYHHSWDQCGLHASTFDKAKGQKVYRKEINDILKDFKTGYQLSKEGHVIELPPTGLESLVSEPISTDKPENIDE